MASIEWIEKRIKGKEKEIAKLEKKRERMLKAKESNWENNPYHYDDLDLKYCEKDLLKAKNILEKLEEDFRIANEKANSRNVKAIIDFLEKWKSNVRKFYENKNKEYVEAYKEFLANIEKYPWKGVEGKDLKEVRAIKKKNKKEFHQKWNFIEKYMPYGKFDTDLFEKDIKLEAERKYDNIIERATKITGTITDATELKIGNTGELDGYIIGEKGVAHVHTISAGGYNVQCFHFRVLVHKVK